MKTKNINVSETVHHELKIVAIHLNMSMRELLAEVSKGMLPLVLQGINPLEPEKEENNNEIRVME